MSKREASTQADSDDEGTGKIIPVKKVQVTSLFKSMPTEISVQDSSLQKIYRSQATFNPLQFLIPPSTNYLDLSQCTLELEVQLSKANGTPLTDINVGIINNVGHSLIKHFTFQLNDTSIEEPTGLYMYKAYLWNLLNFTKDQKDTYLAQEGWATDDAGDAKMNSVTLSATNAPLATTHAAYNGGLMKRTKAFAVTDYQSAASGSVMTTGTVKYIIHPCVDLFQSGRYLVPGVSVAVEVDWNSPEFVMMAAAANTAKFTIKNAVFNIRHVKLNPSTALEIEAKQSEEQKTAIYPIRTTKPIRRTMTTGVAQVDLTDVFQQSVPDIFTLAMVKSTAFNGAKNLNPYYFELFDLQEVQVLVNGMERPRARLELKSRDKMEGYETLLESTGNGHRGFSHGIKREDYNQGYALLRFNLKPDGKDGKNYTYRKNQGTLDLHLKFGTALPENVTLLIFPEFENEILVDPNKVVSMNKNY